MGKFVKLQSLLGVSKSELTVVMIIFSGLLIGLAVKYFDKDYQVSEFDSDSVYKALDSLAEVQKTTYIGTDIKNNPYPELEKGDTIIKKKGVPKKPETPNTNININTASKLDLMKLPGIGEKTALKIIDFRSKTPFTDPSDIMNIKGIGQKKFEKMKAFIKVK